MKEFTLEDLNFGGTNYRNMIPGNRRLTWWGDQLVRLEASECYLVDKKTGKETVLFTLDDVNEWLGGTPDNGLRSLSGARFPYAEQSVVLINYGGERRLVDFKQHKQVWSQCNADELQASSFNTVSRHTAYVDGDQLYFLPMVARIYNSLQAGRVRLYTVAVYIVTSLASIADSSGAPMACASPSTAWIRAW